MDYSIGFWRDELQKNIEGLREANEARERIRTTGYVGNAIVTSLKEVIQLPEVTNAFGYIKLGNTISPQLADRLPRGAIEHLGLGERLHLVVLGDEYSSNILMVAHSGGISPPPAVVRAWGEPGQKMSCSCSDLTPNPPLNFSSRSRPADILPRPPGDVPLPREVTPYDTIVALRAEARPHRFLAAVDTPSATSGPPHDHDMKMKEQSLAADIGNQVGKMAISAAAIMSIREETEIPVNETAPRRTSFGR